MYQHCPFCNIRANRKKVDREKKTAAMDRLNETGLSNEVTVGNDPAKDIIPCIQFLPCGHTFPEQEIERLDRVVKRISQRREEVQESDVEDGSVELILSELNDLESQLETMRWRVKNTRVAPEGPVEHEKAVSPAHTHSITMESGSTIEYEHDVSHPSHNHSPAVGGVQGGQYYGTSPVRAAADEYTGSFTIDMSAAEVDGAIDDFVEELRSGKVEDFSISYEESDVELIEGVPVVTSEEDW
jgi:hypothetical protein